MGDTAGKPGTHFHSTYDAVGVSGGISRHRRCCHDAGGTVSINTKVPEMLSCCQRFVYVTPAASSALWRCWRCCWCYCRGIGDAKHLNSAYLRSRLLSRPRRPLPATMPPLLQYFDCSSTFSLLTYSNFFPVFLHCIIVLFKQIYYQYTVLRVSILLIEYLLQHIAHIFMKSNP